jgi:hypothetical protein
MWFMMPTRQQPKGSENPGKAVGRWCVATLPAPRVVRGPRDRLAPRGSAEAPGRSLTRMSRESVPVPGVSNAGVVASDVPVVARFVARVNRPA